MRNRPCRPGNPDPILNAEKITRQSKSNLALAFVALAPERRRDITTFYAFCRVIDDIADSTALSPREKEKQLQVWRESLRTELPDEPALAPDIRAVMEKYRLPAEMLEEIMAGVEMDLSITRYATFEELRLYCYRVASAVGLVSIEIFGYGNPACRNYAIELGLALQMTNILRDVARDLRNGRIYLPEDDMARFRYSAEDLRAQVRDDRFQQLMQFEAARAEKFFARARALLPPEDRRSMVAAEIMSAVYFALLKKMKSDGFRVFEHDYKLGGLAKLGHVAWQLVRNR
jgi:15-cis-phytoene synthase